jgi:hypothetical protein
LSPLLLEPVFHAKGKSVGQQKAESLLNCTLCWHHLHEFSHDIEISAQDIQVEDESRGDQLVALASDL